MTSLDAIGAGDGYSRLYGPLGCHGIFGNDLVVLNFCPVVLPSTAR
ncbi:MAG: hypothetical protein GXO78_14340 [Calditrichaeota bacterium]|nr:hypothetical protein [Calditrichota bacterium]